MRQILSEILGSSRLEVLDIGARGEIYSRFQVLDDKVSIIGFEPDEAECTRLNENLKKQSITNTRILPYALANSEAERRFYVTRNPLMSSLLEPNHAVMDHDDWKIARIISVHTESLDGLHERQMLGESVDFIKIDTQGSELEILRGGETHFMPYLLGVETEAEFVEQYVHQPRFSEVEQYLRGRQFELMSLDLSHTYSPVGMTALTRRRLMACDAVFLRGKTWLEQLELAAGDTTLRKLVVIYLRYGLCAEAYELAAHFKNAQLQQQILSYYRLARYHDLRWKFNLLRRTIRCILNPSRRNRRGVADFSFLVRSQDGNLWTLLDIHKSV